MKSQEALLCMRFSKDDYKSTIIPVRKAKITFLEYLPNNNSVYFTLENMFNFKDIKSLKDASLMLPGNLQDQLSESLFFSADIDLPLSECTSWQEEDEAWSAYVDLIAKDTYFPINKEAKKSIFLRLRSISSKQRAEACKIHESYSSGIKHGILLHEGNSYDLIFMHRIPCLIGSSASIIKSKLTISSNTGNLEFNTLTDELSANYQRHILTVSAINPTMAYEEITIDKPESETIKTQSESVLNITSLKIPVKVKRSHWYRFKTKYAWLFLIWLSLFLGAIIKAYLGRKDDLFFTNNLNFILVSAGLAVLSAWGVYMLQQKNK